MGSWDRSGPAHLSRHLSAQATKTFQPNRNRNRNTQAHSKFSMLCSGSRLTGSRLEACGSRLTASRTVLHSQNISQGNCVCVSKPAQPRSSRAPSGKIRTLQHCGVFSSSPPGGSSSSHPPAGRPDYRPLFPTFPLRGPQAPLQH